MIDGQDPLSVRRQGQLLGVDRSGLYYAPVSPDAQEIALFHRLDELYTAYPFYGVRRMTEALRREGNAVNSKRVRRWLRQMGLLAVYPKPRLSLPALGQTVFPYLLRGLAIERPHQVWAIDITYVRLRGGFADRLSFHPRPCGRVQTRKPTLFYLAKPSELGDICKLWSDVGRPEDVF